MQNSGHVHDDLQISALDAFDEIDGRKSCYIGEVLDWHRGEDVGDLKRSELNELVENLTCVNALEGKVWKSDSEVVTDEKSWKTWKSNQNSVMNEELVQNGVMDGQRSPQHTPFHFLSVSSKILVFAESF